MDDIHGADMVTPDGNPQDDHGHGTHVAGIIAAQAGNGIGGVGVAYNVQIMALKAAQYSGVLAASDIAEAIYYAVEKGADVINMSFGGYARSQVEEDALAVAFGQAVLVAAAGNDGKVNLPCPLGRDMYPAAYNWVLGVMASTVQGGGYVAGFSNYDCIAARLARVRADGPRRGHLEHAAQRPVRSLGRHLDGGAGGLRHRRPGAHQLERQGCLLLALHHGADRGQPQGGVGGVANAHAALTVAPQPELSYLEHWIFDTAAQAAGNDDDGIVDAGETVDLAIVIRNHWGKADPVTRDAGGLGRGRIPARPLRDDDHRHGGLRRGRLVQHRRQRPDLRRPGGHHRRAATLPLHAWTRTPPTTTSFPSG